MSEQGYQPNAFAFDGSQAAGRVPPPAAYQPVAGPTGATLPPPAAEAWTPTVAPSAAAPSYVPAHAPAPVPGYDESVGWSGGYGSDQAYDDTYAQPYDQGAGPVAGLDGDFDAVASRFDGPDASAVEIEAPQAEDREFDLNEVLVQLLDAGGSDLHITTGASPAMRRQRRAAPAGGPAGPHAPGDPAGAVRDPHPAPAGDVRGEPRARLRVLRAGPVPLPRQHLPPARVRRGGVPRHPLRDQAAGGAGRPAGRQQLRRPAARDGPGHRPDRARASRRRSPRWWTTRTGRARTTS